VTYACRESTSAPRLQYAVGERPTVGSTRCQARGSADLFSFAEHAKPNVHDAAQPAEQRLHLAAGSLGPTSGKHGPLVHISAAASQSGLTSCAGLGTTVRLRASYPARRAR